LNTRIRKIDLVSMSRSALARAGLPPTDADTVITHLLEEELMGKASHGFFRLPGIVKVIRDSHTTCEPFTERETGFSALINGARHLGLVVAQIACNVTAEKAILYGIAIVGMTNYAGTTGAMGYFTRQLAKRNLIGIALCTSEYAVAPWGGRDPILGTNPISIAIPTVEAPVVVDFSTAARTYGELMLAAKDGKRIPEGIVLDSQGMPSTDPNDANNGCQLPMGEHKGYGLGLAIEVLAGTFVGSKAGKSAVVGPDGMLFLAFRPDLFVNPSQFVDNTERLLEEIRHSSLAYGFTAIRIPGEASWKAYEMNRAKPDIEINDDVLQEIKRLAAE